MFRIHKSSTPTKNVTDIDHLRKTSTPYSRMGANNRLPCYLLAQNSISCNHCKHIPADKSCNNVMLKWSHMLFETISFIIQRLGESETCKLNHDKLGIAIQPLWFSHRGDITYRKHTCVASDLVCVENSFT